MTEVSAGDHEEVGDVLDMDQYATVDMVEVDEAVNDVEMCQKIDKDASESEYVATEPAADGGDGETEQEATSAADGEGEGEMVEVETDDDFGDEGDEDEDDDDVKITIGDVKTNINFQTSTMIRASGANKYVSGKLDVDSVATVNGTPIYEVDLNNLEEHPWREPGADLTDYFNYGFTEDTWNIYCDRQRRLRAEYGPENANRYYFSNLTSHYNPAERNKPFMVSSIPTVGSHPPNAYSQQVGPHPSNAYAQQVPVMTNFGQSAGEQLDATAAVVDQQEGGATDQQHPPKSSSITSADVSADKPADTSAEMMNSAHPAMMLGARGMPPAGPMPMPGYPPAGLPPMPGLPMAGLPPPGMMPPFGAPPPGLPFPHQFPYHMPPRNMFFPRGYAGFRNEYNDRRRSVDSYSDMSSDGRRSYERRRKREPYESYRRSRSRERSDYSHRDRRDRSRRKRSRSRDHSRRRSRDRRSRPSRSSQDRGGSQKKSSEKRESRDSVAKETKEDTVQHESDASQKVKPKKTSAEAEPKKTKDKDAKSSKSKHRESSSRKEHESKDRRRDSKAAAASSGHDESKSSAKKKRKHRDSH